jgi:tRNA-uridine 2-sulfurtransferase
VRPGEEKLREHLDQPHGRGHVPDGGFTGAAGGAACGDLVRVTVALDADGRVADAGFDASGCGAAIAAGSATVALVRGRGLLDAARIGWREIADELGGLIPSKLHAAQLAADALHRALGAAARHASLAPVKDRTLVAMSGGVDSAVAALLVAERGEALACTLELWSDPENDGESSCCSAQAVRGARELAHRLGMPHFSIDLREEFRAGVVDGWLSGHAAGLTPNPCIRCNGNVRLDAMLELADRLGAEGLATGHYARVERDGSLPLLRTAADVAKDQSYVLSGLAPASLARLRFPLGNLHKPEVRELARDADLAVAGRRDSQDLCFLAGTGREAFLERHGGLRRRAGEIRARDGRVLGEHAGAHLYTVGQRHGLGLATGTPMYVLSTDARTNTVTVGERAELRAERIEVRDLVLHRDAEDIDAVRVRAHGRRIECRLPEPLGAGRHEGAEVELLVEAERTAPGQLACLYAGELVVGHGTIVR